MIKAYENYILLIGPPKVGKSTWASKLGNAHFIDVERGLKYLNVSKCSVSSWEEVVAELKRLTQEKKLGKLKHQLIVIDTVDRFYDLCFEYVCKECGFDHPSDEGHGKGWSRVSREFINVITSLQALEVGLVFISHSKTKNIATIVKGLEQIVAKECTALSPAPNAVVTALVDLIFCVGYEEKEVAKKIDGKIVKIREQVPILHTKPSAKFEAGDRSGILPERIPFDAEWLVKFYEEQA